MRKLVSLAIIITISAALLTSFALAVNDGEVRRRESALRAFLGDAMFESLKAGEPTQQHYYGNDKLAPDFTLHDKNGSRWRLKEHRGKVVVINFWTITCQPCLEEMPSLQELARLIKNRSDIELVSVTIDANWQDVAPFLEPDTRLRVLFDPKRSVVKDKFGTRLYPETWIIDREGVIRLRIDGAKDWSSPVALDVIQLFAHE